MQVGELALKLDQRMVGAGNVAGAAGAGAHASGSLHHGADDLRMLRHAEIVVGAPDHDIARTLRGVPHSVGETSGNAFEVGEDAIAALIAQSGEGGREKTVVIHAIWLVTRPA